MLERPNVHYFGNVTVGQAKDAHRRRPPCPRRERRRFFHRRPGHENYRGRGRFCHGRLSTPKMWSTTSIDCPGFGDRPFEMGKHVAVIGVGDVMVDIAHWLTRYKKVERVTAIARRGPLERKYNPKEIRAVCSQHGSGGVTRGICPHQPRLAAVGQDADKVLKEMTEEFTKCEATGSSIKMGFRFLASPKRVF